MSGQENGTPETRNNGMALVVKKINPVMLLMLLIVSMVMVNVVIVGLLYGKSDSVKNQYQREQAGWGTSNGPSLKDVLMELYVLANSSGSMRQYINRWVTEKNITIT